MSGVYLEQLAKLASQERYDEAYSIPEDHFYGVVTAKDEKGRIVRGRFSPSGQHPHIIKIDGVEAEFFCSCEKFQKKASYPARMGLFLCDHILRLITLLDGATIEALAFDRNWRCQRGGHDYQREEILVQTKYYFNHNDTLSALTEIFFGIQISVLRDMDVNEILKKLDANSVQDQDLPEAMRFVRVALQRGFARKARELAGAWMERFALRVDSFEPFDDVAPVALWLKRWGAAPDIHLARIREVVLKSLERAKRENGQGASWWLLYRSTSRSGIAPPATCVKTWKKAISDMRLALVNPAGIKDAARLLKGFSISVSGPDHEYIRMHRESLRRAREWRINYLLRLIKAYHLDPFIKVEINPHLSKRFVTLSAKRDGDPLKELILSSIGYKGEYLSFDRFVENWPVIQYCSSEPPKLEGEIQSAIFELWPETPMAPLSAIPEKRMNYGINDADKKHWVVRWNLSGPGLIANSPLVAHHHGRIYIPARGGRDWPDVFGLTLCKNPNAMGRRLFTFEVIRKINIDRAIDLIKSGAPFAGAGDDPVRIFSLKEDELSVDELLNLPERLFSLEKRVISQKWFPDRQFILKNIKAQKALTRAWSRKSLYKAFTKGEITASPIDIGLLFGDGIQIYTNTKVMKKIANMSQESNNYHDWIKKLAFLLIDLLPSLDSPWRPINCGALKGSPLALAAKKLTAARKDAISKITFEAEKGFYDLVPLKNTVYGSMILQNLGIIERNRIRRNEAAELISTLSSVGMSPRALPLFSKVKT